MEQNIKAEEKALRKIFCVDYYFQIPYYQRPYAWTDKEVGELLDDICEAETNNRESPYFLGSIVLEKKEGHNHADVIDGQQRLTTLTILFCVLRELSESKEFKSAFNNCIREEGDPLTDESDHFRLCIRDSDKEFFEKHVQEEGAIKRFIDIHNIEDFTDSRKCMHGNAKYLWNELNKKTQSERESLAKFLMQNCYLVVVSASSRKSAHRIFSVLNTRGLDLLPTDILKADIIGSLPSDEHESYTEKWDNIEERLGRDNFKNLFTHIRMIYMKKKAQEALEEEFQENVIGETNPERLRSFINDTLEPMARAYQIVSEAKYQSPKEAEKVNASLKHLGRIDNKDWIPPAICFFNKYKDDQGALLKFIRDLERLAYTLFTLRKNINERITRYAEIIRAIQNGEDLYKEDISEKKLALQLSENEKAEMRGKLNEPIYEVPQTCKPLLLRLDSLLADTGAEYAEKIISVEHVLPQNPKDCSEWCKCFNEQERQYWTHRLANLVLLSKKKNTQASNLEFNQKKDKYFNKGGTTIFSLTQKVISEDEWTPDVLQKRQKDLLDRFYREWRL